MEKQIDNLIMAYLYRTISDTDMQVLRAWLNESEENKVRFRNLTNLAGLAERVADWQTAGEGEEQAWQLLMERRQHIGLAPIRRINSLKRYWQVAAAVAVIVVGTAIYFGLSSRHGIKGGHDDHKEIVVTTDVQPGGQKAILRLADGDSINLDSSQGGILAKQGNIDILKADGAISYKDNGGLNRESLVNTLIVPKGGQYRLLLSDGTKVWLNSQSSISYPTVFEKNKDRTVNITGEVYFEVAHLTNERGRTPFIVNVPNGVKVEVLGTHFNINAYEDEQAVATTLLEGKVKVVQTNSDKANIVILQPNEQALAGVQPGVKVAKTVDIEQVMAWKNGKFYFKSMKLDVVMRQISRWYNVDIVYEGKVPDFKLNGEASRSSTLANLLNMLANTDVKCRIEGNKLIIPQQ